MRLKLDENLPAELAEVCRGAGHDAHTVREENLSGSLDGAVFGAASSESRILLTQDLDFSDARRYRPGTHPGIVLIRLRNPSRSQLIDRVRDVIVSPSLGEWVGCVVVITDHKIRILRPSQQEFRSS